MNLPSILAPFIHRAMSEQTLQNPKFFGEVAEALPQEAYEKARGAGSCQVLPACVPALRRFDGLRLN